MTHAPWHSAKKNDPKKTYTGQHSGFTGSYSSNTSSSGSQSAYPSHSKAGMQSKQAFGGVGSSSKAGMQSKQGDIASKSYEAGKWAKFGIDTKSTTWPGASIGWNTTSDNQSDSVSNNKATVQLGTVTVNNGIFNTEDDENLKKLEIIRKLRVLNPTWTDIDVANFIEGDDWSMRKFKSGTLSVNEKSWEELNKLSDRNTFGLGLRGDTNIGIALDRDEYGKMHSLLTGNFEAGSETWKRQQILLANKNKFSAKSSYADILSKFPSVEAFTSTIKGFRELFSGKPMEYDKGVNDVGWNSLALRQINRSKQDGILELMPDGSNPINAVLDLGNQEEIAEANKLKSLLGDNYETRAFQAFKKKYQEDIDKEYAELYGDTTEEDEYIGRMEEFANLSQALETGIGSNDISSIYYDGNSFNVNKDFKINTDDTIMNEGIYTKTYNMSNGTTNESIESDNNEENSSSVNSVIAWGGPRDRHSFEWMMTGNRPDGATSIPQETDIKTALNTYNTSQTHKYYYNKFTGKYEHYNVNTGTTEELDDLQMRDLLNLSHPVSLLKQGGIVGFMERI